MTTEEYVRDKRFEVIGLAIKKNDKATKYVSDAELIKRLLTHIDFSDCAILCHNTMFDGAILNWHYGINPKVWFDTMCMSRALHGVETSASLKAVAERYGVGVKGNEVHNAKGKRRADFTDEETERYGEYAKNDVDLTYKLFKIMGSKFPRSELKLIDLTLRMFIEPTLELDLGLLEQHLEDTKERKDKLLRDANVTDKKDLMSNQKFADMLRALGVEPPMKVSMTTGKETYAFAKSDEDFKALQEHAYREVHRYC
jgi:DNA polymerase